MTDFIIPTPQIKVTKVTINERLWTYKYWSGTEIIANHLAIWSISIRLWFLRSRLLLIGR